MKGLADISLPIFGILVLVTLYYAYMAYQMKWYDKQKNEHHKKVLQRQLDEDIAKQILIEHHLNNNMSSKFDKMLHLSCSGAIRGGIMGAITGGVPGCLVAASLWGVINPLVYAIGY